MKKLLSVITFIFFLISIHSCKEDATSSIAPSTPTINAYPTALNFGSDADTLNIGIFKRGTGTLNWQIQNLTSWVNASPASGSLQTTDTIISQIIVNRGSLAGGDYNQIINVVNSNNTSNKVSISISMAVDSFITGYVQGRIYYSGTLIPISGAVVNIDSADYTTGSNGFYQLNNIVVGNKILRATKDGFDTYLTNIDVVEGQNTQDIEMTSQYYTHKLYGTITSTSTLQPLQGVNITLLNDNGTPSQLHTTSDNNGFYQLNKVPEGLRKIKFQKQNYRVITPEITMGFSDYQFDTQLQYTACDTVTKVNWGSEDYLTIEIGSQCWLKKNLNIGTMITGGQSQTNNGIFEKYCYDNDPNNCNFYGGLYQWNETMQYTTTPGTQGICPLGWHIPTFAEYQTLSTAVGGASNALKAIGQGVGGGAGTNTSGFSVLLAGLRRDYGSFDNLNLHANFWTSTEYDALSVRGIDLHYNNNIIDSFNHLKGYGFSVRCLKD